MSDQPAPTINNTQTIARNAFWYGLELVFGLFGGLVSTIVVARVIGPEQLGYFSYVWWLTNITTTVGSLGMPLTTRKYMAEYLNRGEAGVARAVYETALKLQVLIAIGMTVAGLALTLAAGDPAYRAISVLLVLTMAPRVIAFIPSQANSAAEVMKRNTRPSVITGALNLGLTLFSLWIGWNLVGLAASFVLCATLEMIFKLRGVAALLGGAPKGTISPELKRRIFTYSGQGIALMILNIVVWDRSDVVILKAMNHDIRQVTFFSMAFNLTERLMSIPTAFGASLSATMMAQYGRGVDRLHELTMTGAKYTLLLALPLLAGMACISRPMILLLYGQRYEPLIPVLSIAAVLAISKAITSPAGSLLQTVENQGFLIAVGCVCGAIDIALDILLTPTHGAVGAALANGLSQTLAAAAIWWRVRRLSGRDLRLGEFGRIAVSGLAMAAAVQAVNHVLSGYVGMFVSIVCGVLVWFGMLRLTGAIDKTDGERLAHLGRAMPEGFRPVFRFLTGLVTAGR